MVAVSCVFQPDGTVQLKQVQINGRWQAVGQGRQWVDSDGRHLLLQLPGGQIRHLLLRADTLTWQWQPQPNQAQMA